MNDNEKILMRTAVDEGKSDEIVIRKIAQNYAEPSEQEWTSIAEGLTDQGLLEPMQAGVYCATPSGRTTWESERESDNRATSREVKRRNPPWQRT